MLRMHAIVVLRRILTAMGGCHGINLQKADLLLAAALTLPILHIATRIRCHHPQDDERQDLSLVGPKQTHNIGNRPCAGCLAAVAGRALPFNSCNV